MASRFGRRRRRRGSGAEAVSTDPSSCRRQQARPAAPRGLVLRHRLRELVQDGFIGRELGTTALTGAQMLSHRTECFRLRGVQQDSPPAAPRIDHKRMEQPLLHPM